MKLAILDCIGTLNVEGEDSIVAFKDWRPQEGALEAVAQLNRGGWYVTLATNQPGLGRGSFDVTELNVLHQRMLRELAAVGARIEAVFFCPHTPDEHCACRKPAPGLLQQIATRYGAEPHEVWVIGQESKHLQAGEAMGANLVWLQLGAQAPATPLKQDVPQFASWKLLADALAPDVQTTVLSSPPSPLTGN
ncbi:D-glycero-alpha-D-manno-heptose-1,7-bisphosphate 7-phosphatase [Comamonas avium]|uniref:D,D-heptose 1,7-bisphosphate phosphatase n=1 Tax=Comamonas avium TaxID=2762231 RepID=A0ABR8SA33_9BURK|nr:HAD-IIIA family hydrolase [Comamonas avium]MBD7960300.1 HAD-IIIA family hydrolase [Comamonas avium]